MGREVNLLDVYPKSKRPVEGRLKEVTVLDRLLARRFGKEYFDGTRNQGYGGYNYHPRFWQPVVKRMQKYYHLTSKSKILDVGCGKGFMLHDFRELIPGITVAGIDISKYAIESTMPDVKPFVKVGNALKLPFPDKSFDLVIVINTIHNLPLEDCFTALQEIQRVGKKDMFVINDAYRTEKQRQDLLKWNLTALAILSTKGWKELFKLAGYKGDYYWFTPR
jgi:ubiquinone/menaquinone biosynthesis C-methylase UbiE